MALRYLTSTFLLTPSIFHTWKWEEPPAELRKCLQYMEMGILAFFDIQPML